MKRCFIIIIIMFSCVLSVNAQKKIPVNKINTALSKSKIRIKPARGTVLDRTYTINSSVINSQKNVEERIAASQVSTPKTNIHVMRRDVSAVRIKAEKKNNRSPLRNQEETFAGRKDVVEYKPLSSTEDIYWIQYIDNEIKRAMLQMLIDHDLKSEDYYTPVNLDIERERNRNTSFIFYVNHGYAFFTV